MGLPRWVAVARTLPTWHASQPPEQFNPTVLQSIVLKNMDLRSM